MPEQDTTGRRGHIILVPGFVGFDALGQISYYAGVTSLFEEWRAQSELLPAVSLHYFDNFPTASVELRAQRLLRYIATRMQRGEFASTDRIALVGHSTGGLDIRKLLYELASDPDGRVVADGTSSFAKKDLERLVSKLVFLSVPHFGTGLADYFVQLADTLKAVIKDAGVAVQLNRPPVAALRNLLTRKYLSTGSDLLLAVFDSLNESDEDRAGGGAARANEREARSMLALWLEHMGKDLSIIEDLRSAASGISDDKTPSHFDLATRNRELNSWKRLGITTVSYVTIVPKAAGHGRSSPALDWLLRLGPVLNTGARVLNDAAGRWWSGPVAAAAVVVRAVIPVLSLPELLELLDRRPSTVFDVFYSLCASDKGAFEEAYQLHQQELVPALTDLVSGRSIARSELDVGDSDGVVNTLSMLWPHGGTEFPGHEHYRVQADHGDIIGHYKRKANPAPQRFGRRFFGYDIFPSQTAFDDADFKRVWFDVFKRCLQSF